VRSKTKVCGRLTAGIAGSNIADGIVVSGLLCVVSVVSSATWWISRYRLVLTGVRVCVCLIVRDPGTPTMRRP
jgi:hypothetical protein